jgi:hypothetical protein
VHSVRIITTVGQAAIERRRRRPSYSAAAATKRLSQGSKRGQQFTSLKMSASASWADISQRPSDVRFTPESGHQLRASGCPLCANSGLMQCSNIVIRSPGRRGQAAEAVWQGRGSSPFSD